MSAVPPLVALRSLWRDLGLAQAALDRVALEGEEPVLPSSFAVGTAAQVSLAAAALAAAEIGRIRFGTEQIVSVDMQEAALECCGCFRVDGRAPELWDPIAGLYRCQGGGWVRVHTNFAHHRDGLLRLLGLAEGAATPREQVAAAIACLDALALEQVAAERGLVVAALRDFEAWDAHPQSAAVAALPLVEIERIGDAPPLAWPSTASDDRPLAGLRVLDLTRVLAGPVAGRTFAAYGAEVMLVNSPHLPNIAAIADTSRGKRSALADLRDSADRERFTAAVHDVDVFIDGYRPGGLAALGFAPADTARIRPGIVHICLSAYGRAGPWAPRRGFDSLVQTATGFNVAEAKAAGSEAPQPLPMQILDMATGFLIALGAECALMRQREQGGSWIVRVSLARTAAWLRGLGRVENGFAAPKPSFDGHLVTTASGFGLLAASPHAARFSKTPARYARASMPPGHDPLDWG